MVNIYHDLLPPFFPAAHLPVRDEYDLVQLGAENLRRAAIGDCGWKSANRYNDPAIVQAKINCLLLLADGAQSLPLFSSAREIHDFPAGTTVMVLLTPKEFAPNTATPRWVRAIVKNHGPKKLGMWVECQPQTSIYRNSVQRLVFDPYLLTLDDFTALRTQPNFVKTWLSCISEIMLRPPNNRSANEFLRALSSP